MQLLIKGIRYSKYDMTLSEVHEKACEKARLLGEPEPSMWQVRAVLSTIDEQVLTVADGRLGDYRNKFRTTYRFRFDGTVIIYQIDWTIVPVLIKDLRRTGVRRKGGETRAYMTLCVEASSGAPPAAIFTYDTPDRYTIGSVIHDALLITEKKPYGGIPDEIWVDQGKQMISKHVRQIARDLHINLHPCIPHDREDRGNPQENGKVERLNRTLQTELWAKMPGYVGSNTVERNPNAQAELTIYDIVERFWEFINNKYLQEKHGDEKTTPKEYWAEHCHTWPPDDERELDILLQEGEWKKLHKEGIQHDSRVYWSEDFGSAIPIETNVFIRSHPRYTRPDDILVFYEGQRVRAVARDSEEGRGVTGEQIAIAQRRQKAAIRRVIEEGRVGVREADSEIAKQKKQTASQATPSTSSDSQTPASASQPAQSRPSRRVKLPTDPWERLLYLKQQKQQGQPGGH
jgi:transposase InsO family protein